MAITLRTPDKKLKLQLCQLRHMRPYLETCVHYGFVGINNYSRTAPEREIFYRECLLSFCEKLLHKLMHTMHEPAKKIATLKVSLCEEMALVCIFQRVDCDDYMLAMQAEIMQQLKPIDVRTRLNLYTNNN